MTTNRELDLPHIIERLLPQSRAWLIARGYVERDGEALQVTPAGYAYFAKIIYSGR